MASILSSYAFTIAGFLAAIVTFLYTLGERPYFKLYRNRGSFADLMFVHFFHLALLGLLFITAIGLVVYPQLMRLALTLSLLSLLHLAVLIFISFNLAKRSNDAI